MTSTTNRLDRSWLLSGPRLLINLECEEVDEAGLQPVPETVALEVRGREGGPHS